MFPIFTIEREGETIGVIDNYRNESDELIFSYFDSDGDYHESPITTLIKNGWRYNDENGRHLK